MSADDLLIARIERIETRLAVLESKLDPDAAKLQSILPAIAAVTNGLAFRIGDLDVDFHGLSAPQVGKLFARHVGVPVSGYRIERTRGFHSGGRGWRVTPIHNASPSAHDAAVETDGANE